MDVPSAEAPVFAGMTIGEVREPRPYASEGRGRGGPLFFAVRIQVFAGMTGYRVKTGPRMTLASSLAMKVAILATSSGLVRLAISDS